MILASSIECQLSDSVIFSVFTIAALSSLAFLRSIKAPVSSEQASIYFSGFLY